MRPHRDDRDDVIRDGSPWVDKLLRDRHGDLVGLVVDVYDDPRTARPAWLAVASGYFGTHTVVVPVAGAAHLGDDIVVPFDRTTIDASPPASTSVVVTEADHRLLEEHYVVSPRTAPLGPGSTT